MLSSVLSDTPSEGLKEEAQADGESMEDTTPELGVERGLYQQDTHSVCNASPRLPLRSLKRPRKWDRGALSNVAKPGITVQEFMLLTSSGRLKKTSC